MWIFVAFAIARKLTATKSRRTQTPCIATSFLIREHLNLVYDALCAWEVAEADEQADQAAFWKQQVQIVRGISIAIRFFYPARANWRSVCIHRKYGTESSSMRDQDFYSQVPSPTITSQLGAAGCLRPHSVYTVLRHGQRYLRSVGVLAKTGSHHRKGSLVWGCSGMLGTSLLIFFVSSYPLPLSYLWSFDELRK